MGPDASGDASGGAVAPWAAEEWAREPAGELEPEFAPAPEPEPAQGDADDVRDVHGEHDIHGERDIHGEPEPVGTVADEAHAFADVAAESAEESVRVPAAEDSEVREAPEIDEGPEALEAAEAPAPEDAVADEPDPDAVVAPLHDDHPLASYVLRVNGTDRPVTGAWIGESLLYVLRERLGLAGAKDGCSQGECGACNVQVDGRLVASCLVPGATAAGSEVRTVEGLAADGQPSDVQRALAGRCAVQCGFCVPGMAMTVHDLLEGNPAPTELETRQALCGNLCRCSGYRGILDAVQQVVTEREASATSGTTATGSTSAGDAEGKARIPHQAGPSATEGIQDGGLA